MQILQLALCGGGSGGSGGGIYIYISVTRSHTTESRYENNIGAACGSPYIDCT